MPEVKRRHILGTSTHVTRNVLVIISDDVTNSKKGGGGGGSGGGGLKMIERWNVSINSPK